MFSGLCPNLASVAYSGVPLGHGIPFESQFLNPYYFWFMHGVSLFYYKKWTEYAVKVLH